jgi:hypothetical protein
MKYALYSALVAIWAIAVFASVAKADDRCFAYDDEKTDFTWRLCPAGENF